MRKYLPMLILLLYAMPSSIAFSDVFSWTDTDGVRHFSNVQPWEPTQNLRQIDEFEHDEEAARYRYEIERRDEKLVTQEKILYDLQQLKHQNQKIMEGQQTFEGELRRSKQEVRDTANRLKSSKNNSHSIYLWPYSIARRHQRHTYRHQLHVPPTFVKEGNPPHEPQIPVSVALPAVETTTAKIKVQKKQ